MVEEHGRLVIGGRTWAYRLDRDSVVAACLPAFLPLRSQANNIGGEIWFRTWGLDLPYDGTQTSAFRAGDLVYWRAPDGEARYCLALFYGPTPFGDGTDVRSASPCVRVGSLLGDLEGLAAVRTGDEIFMEQESA